MDKEMSISQLEATFIDDLNQLDDWELEYEYLLQISADLPHVPAEELTEAHKVKGCQSGVWVVLNHSEGRINVQVDSEALIIRGILSIIVHLLDERTPEEIVDYQPQFIEKTNIRKQISTDRFHGIQSVISVIKSYARQFV